MGRVIATALCVALASATAVASSLGLHDPSIFTPSGRAFMRAAVRRAADANAAAPLIATYANDTIDSNGWVAFRQSRTEAGKKADDASVYYAAGFAEGQVLQKRIYQHFVNTVRPTPKVTIAPRMKQWLDEHMKFMYEQVALYALTDRYWRQVHLLLMQLEGVTAGYGKVAPTAQALDFFDIFALNFQYEMGDIAVATKVDIPSMKGDWVNARGGCSSIVKYTGDDLLHAHTTWDNFNCMLRVYKEYNFGAVKVGFSGYPGLIASGDDFYVLSTKMSVIETTNLMYNNALYVFTVPETVSEFLRVMIANQLAVDGRSWTETFCRFNSGTYNNQYMVVNYNLFTPNTPQAQLPDNLFWITEQMPGMCPKQDATHVLREKGYWASYNLPYTPFVFNAAGTQRMETEYGAYFSYTQYARAKIFARDHHKVKDVRGAQQIIRYNEWQSDPLSVCPGCDPQSSPMLTLSSRGDLIPANGTWGKWSSVAGLQGPVAFGAVDGKIASYSMFENGNNAVVVSGPTHETQIPFRWSTSPAGKLPASKASHVGQADLQAFPWVRTEDLFKYSPVA